MEHKAQFVHLIHVALEGNVQRVFYILEYGSTKSNLQHGISPNTAHSMHTYLFIQVNPPKAYTKLKCRAIGNVPPIPFCIKDKKSKHQSMQSPKTTSTIQEVPNFLAFI